MILYPDTQVYDLSLLSEYTVISLTNCKNNVKDGKKQIIHRVSSKILDVTAGSKKSKFGHHLLTSIND